ncbi:MAG: HEPN domain-containing protein [Longimicrobiales bacterium]
MPLEPRDSADPREWLRRDRSNLARARAGRATHEVLYEDLCFDAQQAAEKSIKGVLIRNGIPFPKTHVIDALLTQAELGGVVVPDDMRESVVLTDYATFARYPGPGEDVTQDEYERAVKLAEGVVAWAETLVS